MSSFLILALASSALAVPFAGEQAHARHRYGNHVYSSGAVDPTGVVRPTGTGAPYPFPIANATGWYGSAGTAVSSDFASSTNLAAASDLDDSSVPTSEAQVEAESTSCSQSTTYVTSTNRVTLTVYQSSTASASAEATSVSLNLRKKAYEGKQRWRKSSTVGSSTTSAVATSAVASTMKASSTSTSVSVAASSTSATASSTTSSAAASQSASTGGKRGVAYNDASLTTPFEGSTEVSWGYNWGQTSSGLSSSFNFVPLLWGTSSTFTNGWAATVSAAAANGVTHLMSFNEPDLGSQADLSPADAAAAYKKYMQPYAGQFKLGAPAVTNGGGAMGLNWLSAFLDACDGCTIDFVAAHWYDSPSNTAYFKEHVANITEVAGGKPVWLTEFGVTSGSDSDISTFLETVLPWLDSQDYVERYAYFMVADGLLVSGGETSSYGSTYKSYTSSS